MLGNDFTFRPQKKPIKSQVLHKNRVFLLSYYSCFCRNGKYTACYMLRFMYNRIETPPKSFNSERRGKNAHWNDEIVETCKYFAYFCCGCCFIHRLFALRCARPILPWFCLPFAWSAYLFTFDSIDHQRRFFSSPSFAQNSRIFHRYLTQTTTEKLPTNQ